jgi:hypothetical protein
MLKTTLALTAALLLAGSVASAAPNARTEGAAKQAVARYVHNHLDTAGSYKGYQVKPGDAQGAHVYARSGKSMLLTASNKPTPGYDIGWATSYRVGLDANGSLAHKDGKLDIRVAPSAK